MVKAGNDGTGSRLYSMVGFGNKGLGSAITLLVIYGESHNSKHDTIISSSAFTQKHKLPYITQTDEKMGIIINNKKSFKMLLLLRLCKQWCTQGFCLGCSTNSVEDRGQRERGSGGVVAP